MTDDPECTCPLIDTSRFGPRGGVEIAFLLGDPRGSGCPIHETQAMRDEVREAERRARYGERNPGGPVLPPQPYLYDPAVDGPLIPIRPDPWLAQQQPDENWWSTLPGVMTIIGILVALLIASALIFGTNGG